MVSALSINAQTASNYFPSQQGYKWYTESIPLDSLNNPISSLKYYGIDSFAVVSPYFGKSANIVLTKTGSESTINLIPFLDSVYFNFEGANGNEYFNPEVLPGLLSNIDTTLGINFINFFNPLKGWYPYYRFSSPNNVEYQIFKKDTAITVNSISATLRFELIGKKLADETLNTEIGAFDCKKFLREFRISYLLIIPIINDTIAIKMFGVENTDWLAPDNWKVKSYIPTTNVDLSYLGLPAFKIPGLESNILSTITEVENEPVLINDFKLNQNFPNPFNPSTTISWQIPVRSQVNLKLLNVLGEELETLVNELQEAGSHFKLYTTNSNLTSGIYFYQLKVGNFIQTKKMVLIK